MLTSSYAIKLFRKVAHDVSVLWYSWYYYRGLMLSCACWVGLIGLVSCCRKSVLYWDIRRHRNGHSLSTNWPISCHIILRWLVTIWATYWMPSYRDWWTKIIDCGRVVIQPWLCSVRWPPTNHPRRWNPSPRSSSTMLFAAWHMSKQPSPSHPWVPSIY